MQHFVKDGLAKMSKGAMSWSIWAVALLYLPYEITASTLNMCTDCSRFLDASNACVVHDMAHLMST